MDLSVVYIFHSLISDTWNIVCVLLSHFFILWWNSVFNSSFYYSCLRLIGVLKIYMLYACLLICCLYCYLIKLLMDVWFVCDSAKMFYMKSVGVVNKFLLHFCLCLNSLVEDLVWRLLWHLFIFICFDFGWNLFAQYLNPRGDIVHSPFHRSFWNVLLYVSDAFVLR